MSETKALRQEFGQFLSDLDFMDLDHRLQAPNIFNIFQMEYVAAKHSTFLGWLLDPNESHGLEDKFLRRFMAAALASGPPDRGKATEGISPIPYAAVYEKLLKWDRMDILSADLRETNVATDLCRRTDGKRIDICIWNEPYAFAVYVENRVVPSHSWRLARGLGRTPREYDSERCLLDLYSQWGAEEAGGYEILPVFLSLADERPSETRCFHYINYSWMPSFLDRLACSATVSEKAAAMIADFCEWLRLERPQELDPALFEKLTRLTRDYGRTICRLVEHVSECSGCDETDLLGGYHDVYRRHKHTIDYLGQFADSVPDAQIKSLRSKVEALIDDEDVIIEEGPASLSLVSRRWKKAISNQGVHGLEVFASSRSLGCGVVVYTGVVASMLDRLLAVAEEVGEEMDLAVVRPERAISNFRLVKFNYEAFDPVQTAADFVRCYRFLGKLFERLDSRTG